MRPAVLPAHPWSFPEPEIVRLPTGLEVWLFDMPGQFVAACDLVLPTPLAKEPRHVEGVGTVALTAIDEGTLSNPAGRITELLELQGAAVHGSAHQSSTRISLDCPAYRLPASLPLLAEVLLEPEYDPADIARHIEWQVAAFETRLASPGAVARQALRAALFGDDHREGRPAAGTPQTLNAITPEDVRTWHTRHISPDNATLILAGDFTGISSATLLEPFGYWQGGTAGSPITSPRQVPRTVLVDMPDAVQATVHLATVTIGRTSPDWAALKLAGHALAGAFSSRLNLELRERRGLTYGISGGFSARREDGWFGISGNFSVEGTAEALRRILDEVALDDPFSDREVEDVRRYLIGVGPLANETAGSIAHQAAMLAAAGISSDYVNQHLAALSEPDSTTVTRTFREHISPEQLTIAIAGPATQLIPALEGAGISAEVV